MYADAETIYRATIVRSPTCWMAHNNLGIALVRQGKVVEAIGHFQRAVDLDPNYAKAHSNLGAALTKLGRFNEAIEHCRKAVELQPGFAEAQNHLGNALWVGGHLDEAADHYRTALQLDPEYAAAKSNLGNVYCQKGRIEDAIACYEASLRMDPRYVDAHLNLGAVFILNGKPNEALAQWREAVRLNPRDIETINAMAWLLATGTESSVRNGKEALILAEQAAALSGRRNCAILDTLAAAYAEAGRFAEAVQTAEKAAQWAVAAGDQMLAEKIRIRLGLYRDGKPYRQPPSR
jgi:tetratricopeptide (TPR) repeat protein